jgi:hypothetical protein
MASTCQDPPGRCTLALSLVERSRDVVAAHAFEACARPLLGAVYRGETLVLAPPGAARPAELACAVLRAAQEASLTGCWNGARVVEADLRGGDMAQNLARAHGTADRLWRAAEPAAMGFLRQARQRAAVHGAGNVHLFVTVYTSNSAWLLDRDGGAHLLLAAASVLADRLRRACGGVQLEAAVALRFVALNGGADGAALPLPRAGAGAGAAPAPAGALVVGRPLRAGLRCPVAARAGACAGCELEPDFCAAAPAVAAGVPPALAAASDRLVLGLALLLARLAAPGPGPAARGLPAAQANALLAAALPGVGRLFFAPQEAAAQLADARVSVLRGFLPALFEASFAPAAEVVQCHLGPVRASVLAAVDPALALQAVCECVQTDAGDVFSNQQAPRVARALPCDTEAYVARLDDAVLYLRSPACQRSDAAAAWRGAGGSAVLAALLEREALYDAGQPLEADGSTSQAHEMYCGGGTPL